MPWTEYKAMSPAPNTISPWKNHRITCIGRDPQGSLSPPNTWELLLYIRSTESAHRNPSFCLLWDFKKTWQCFFSLLGKRNISLDIYPQKCPECFNSDLPRAICIVYHWQFSLYKVTRDLVTVAVHQFLVATTWDAPFTQRTDVVTQGLCNKHSPPAM